MFGAPSGAVTSLGKSFTEFAGVSPILPLNGGSGCGKTVRAASCADAAEIASTLTNVVMARSLYLRIEASL